MSTVKSTAITHEARVPRSRPSGQPKALELEDLVELEVVEETFSPKEEAPAESDAETVEIFAAVQKTAVHRCFECVKKCSTTEHLEQHKTTISHLNRLSELIGLKFKCDYCRQIYSNRLHYHSHTRREEHKKRWIATTKVIQNAIQRKHELRLTRAHIYHLTADEVDQAYAKFRIPRSTISLNIFPILEIE